MKPNSFFPRFLGINLRELGNGQGKPFGAMPRKIDLRPRILTATLSGENLSFAKLSMKDAHTNLDP